MSAQLLRTCRQIYAEGLSILYGENTFHIKIFNTWGPYMNYIDYSNIVERAFKEASDSGAQPQKTEILPLLRRFEIEVRYTDQHKLSLLRESAREIVAELQEKVPRIDRLLLNCKLYCRNENTQMMWDDPCWYDYYAEGDHEECSRMLRTWFGRLRSIKEVVTKGMYKEDAEILKERLRREEALDKRSLADEYEVLEEQVKGYRFCDKALSRALLAAERDDEEEFEACKKTIVKSVRQRWEKLRDALRPDTKEDTKME